MPKRTSDKPKVAIKREQRLLAALSSAATSLKVKADSKNILAIILKQILKSISVSDGEGTKKKFISSDNNHPMW